MDFCNKYIRQQYGSCPADPQGLPIFRHPSQLYEAALEGLVLFSVIWVLSHRLKKLQKPGLVMGTFIAGYGIVRILLENVRNPDAQMPEFLRHLITMGMILSLPMVVAGGFFIWNAMRPDTAEPTTETGDEATTSAPNATPEIHIDLPVKPASSNDETAA